MVLHCIFYKLFFDDAMQIWKMKNPISRSEIIFVTAKYAYAFLSRSDSI